MDPNTFPTKGNLILAKNSLALSKQGYELMDKKRNILIREMMELIDQAKDIQTQIDETFRTAYAALQKANMEIGIAFVDQISHTVPVENSLLMAMALRKAGVPVELHVFPDGEHGLSLASKLVERADGSGVQEECQQWIGLADAWLGRLCKGAQ